MKNAPKAFFPVKPKEDFWIMVSFLCFFLGLVIQLIIIVCSFAWSGEQFGLPKTFPTTFILATLLTLVPILSYIIFINFLLLFVSTFHGAHLFSHPWFYHLFGMLIFNIGITLFIMVNRAVNQKTK